MLWKPENCEWKKINPLLFLNKELFLSVYFPWFPFLSLHFCSWFPCLVSTGFRVWFPSLLLKQQGGVSGFPRMVCRARDERPGSKLAGYTRLELLLLRPPWS